MTNNVVVSLSACVMIAIACGSGPEPSPLSPPERAATVLTALSALRTCGRAGLNVPVVPTVQVWGRSGTQLANVPVRFVIGSGGGEVRDSVVMTDGSGVARATTWRLGSAPGENTLTASVAGSSPLTFTAIVTRWNLIATYDLKAVGGRALPRIYSAGGRTWSITGGHYALSSDGTYSYGYEVDGATWTSNDVLCSMSPYTTVDSTLRFYVEPGMAGSQIYQLNGGLFATAALRGNLLTLKYADFLDYEDEVYVLSTASNRLRVSAP